ncbi:MAG: NAD(P)H-dependent oxidoreductase [Chlamydiales bacterium]|nr:NAD(P)H-dependent oxidoreductase [Chlamydiales bacterium]
MKTLLIFLLCFVFSINLNAEVRALAFAGSSRCESVNKKLVLEAANIAKSMGASVTYIDLKEYPIPLYDADLEATNGMPENAKYIRGLMANSQLIMIASPDYNGSVSALLKNVLDWASRGEKGGASRDAFKGKKFALMSASPSASGGAKGLIHLKTIIETIGGTVIAKQVVVPRAHQAFNNESKLIDQRLCVDLHRLVYCGMN